METSIIINSTKDGKKYQKSIAKINPEKDNVTLNEFAGMVNALSTNTFQGGSRVDKMSLSEQGGGSTTTGLLNPNLRITDGKNGILTWDGDGVCKVNGSEVYIKNYERGTTEDINFVVLTSDGTYAKDWLLP